MSNYRRFIVTGGTYFFTQVTYKRIPWLCSEIGRKTVREGLRRAQKIYPFSIDAIVLLPDHFHCIWTLPDGDSNYTVRWRYIKSFVTRSCQHKLNISVETSESRNKRKEGYLWQRRYWEHLIRDQHNFNNHCDYIHFNPVKHGFCESPKDWQFSSFHRFVQQGFYPEDWGGNNFIYIPEDVGKE